MPRSGSTLLCDLLFKTGIAGRPNSFFRPQSMADFATGWNVPVQTLDGFDQSYIDTVLMHGSAGTGCFGMRIMWNNIARLSARLGMLHPEVSGDFERLQVAFGPMDFIHLTRADKVAEAVSLTIAEQSGLWHRNADGSEMERTAPSTEPAYDFAQIQAAYREVTEGQDAWYDWFTAQGIEPLAVTYEALAKAPVTELARILEFLGLDPEKANGITPGTAKLATRRNFEWAARFRADAGLAPGPVTA